MYVSKLKFQKNENEIQANQYIESYLKKNCPLQYFKQQLSQDSSKSFTSLTKSNSFNIVYVVDLKTFLHKMSRVRFWAIDELSKQTNVELFITGKNWTHFKENWTIQDNLNSLGVQLHTVIWYKPLDNCFVPLTIPTCIRYNEMWDIPNTIQEIQSSKSDIVICHHKNDYEYYKDIYEHHQIQVNYIPHHARPDIFHPTNIKKDIDILISGVTTEKHYPFKHRLAKLLIQYRRTKLKDYNIVHHTHPGYANEINYTDINQKNYADIINRSRICIVCSSKYNYRLGKYVEIPMCGSVMCGDLPYEDKESYTKMMIVLNQSMSDNEIILAMTRHLENDNLLKQKTDYGIQWSKQYTTSCYTQKLTSILKSYKPTTITVTPKIFIISDEIPSNHPEFNKQQWICDVLKSEFSEYYSPIVTNNASEATVVWYLAPWNYKYIPKGFSSLDLWYKHLNNVSTFATIHHIDETKYKKGEHTNMFDFIRNHIKHIHSICNPTTRFLKSISLNKPISQKLLWYNPSVFYPIENKEMLREKYHLNTDKTPFLIGSFQKDTEGSSIHNKSYIPKLSKGPDLFVSIVYDMQQRHPEQNIQVILTGLRREYIIQQLEKHNITYHYFHMLSLPEINELYNCLDLYLVSSRYEGGPRSLFEAGACKTPIISTHVGVAEELLPNKSLFNQNKWITYLQANPDVEYVYNKIQSLSINKQMRIIKQYLLS